MSNTDGLGARHPFFTQRESPVPRPRKLVRVRAIGPRRFCVDGKAVPLGEIVNVDDFSAADLVAVGKAELVT